MALSQREAALWNKIESFRLDDSTIDFTFSQRLARENRWSRQYTDRVITEYKRFIFLCAISPGGITPSDPVDQVWHLHLTYTKSYWIDFCQNTIGVAIHHNPTKGGVAEFNKFDRLYTSSQNIYWEKFGVMPPMDIWHDNNTRFSDIDFQRVNLKRNWVIRKPAFLSNKVIGTLVVVLAGIVSIQATYGLQLFIVLGIVIFLVAVFVVALRTGNKGGHDGGDSAGSGCSSFDSSESSHGDHSDGSGCSSGCSGCSSSGCSGCGSGN